MPRSDINAYGVHTKVNQLSLSLGSSGEGRSVPLHQWLRKLKIREKLNTEVNQALLLPAQIPGEMGHYPHFVSAPRSAFWDLSWGNSASGRRCHDMCIKAAQWKSMGLARGLKNSNASFCSRLSVIE